MPPSMEVNGRTGLGGHKDINTIVDDIGHHRNRTSPADGSSLHVIRYNNGGFKEQKEHSTFKGCRLLPYTHICPFERLPHK